MDHIERIRNTENIPSFFQVNVEDVEKKRKRLLGKKSRYIDCISVNKDGTARIVLKKLDEMDAPEPSKLVSIISVTALK